MVGPFLSPEDIHWHELKKFRNINLKQRKRSTGEKMFHIDTDPMIIS